MLYIMIHYNNLMMYCSQGSISAIFVASLTYIPTDYFSTNPGKNDRIKTTVSGNTVTGHTGL